MRPYFKMPRFVNALLLVSLLSRSLAVSQYEKSREDRTPKREGTIHLWAVHVSTAVRPGASRGRRHTSTSHRPLISALCFSNSCPHMRTSVAHIIAVQRTSDAAPMHNVANINQRKCIACTKHKRIIQGHNGCG